MNKKSFFLLILSIMTLVSANAQTWGVGTKGIRRITLTKLNVTYFPTGTNPYSLDDPSEIPFDVIQSDDNIEITALNDLGQVSIEIVSVSNVVYSNTMTMIDGEVVSIATDGLPTGWYNIYIYIGDIILVGEFEL